MIEAPSYPFRLRLDDLKGKVKLLSDLVEEVNPPLQRLNQGDFEVGASKGDHDSWESRPASYIRKGGTFFTKGGDGVAILDMPIPDSFGFAWSDQPPLDSGGFKEVGKAKDLCRAIPKKFGGSSFT